MGVFVAEDLAAPVYPFTDPSAILVCDAPACDAPWVTRTGLVAWALVEDRPSGSRFTDRLIIACSPACLAAAQRAQRWCPQAWSPPMPVGVWLDALRDSLDRDPETTPIGAFALPK
jgi:hypothetical protein